MSIRIDIDHTNENDREVQKLPKKETPGFAEHNPDLEEIERKAADHEFEHLVIIGNGGSITTFRAYLYALLDEIEVDVRLVTTMDPDYLNRLSKQLDSEKTLIMPISKSGETIGVIESLLYFIKRDYPVFAVTSDNDGALRNIVERNDYDWIEHPEVGGRFSGLTETALVPAAFAGIDIREIRKGGEKMYEKLSPDNQYNPALNLASALYDAEQRGYDEVFAPFYSTRLFGFYPLFVQLMHETVCKDGKGQTIFGDIGPECQHHTNQRVFGGKKDIITTFFRCDAHEREEIRVDENISDIEIRGKKLSELEGKTLKDSLKSEYQGVKDAMDKQSIPNITLNITSVSHENLGKLVALMQYVAVYSAWLRDVDPFNQPDVEKSKDIGFKERFNL